VTLAQSPIVRITKCAIFLGGSSGDAGFLVSMKCQIYTQLRLAPFSPQESMEMTPSQNHSRKDPQWVA